MSWKSISPARISSRGAISHFAISLSLKYFNVINRAQALLEVRQMRFHNSVDTCIEMKCKLPIWQNRVTLGPDIRLKNAHTARSQITCHRGDHQTVDESE